MSAPLGVTVDDLLTEAGHVYAGLHAPALAELIQLRVQVRQQADETARLRAQLDPATTSRDKSAATAQVVADLTDEITRLRAQAPTLASSDKDA